MLDLDEGAPERAPWTHLEDLPGGSQGAARWRAASGENYVAKRHPLAAREHLREVLVRMDRARAAGLPVPAARLVCGGGQLYLLATELPGRSGGVPTRALIGQLLAARGALAGLATDRGDTWRALMRESLVSGLSGYCEHASLDGFSPDAHALLTRIRSVPARIRWERLPVTDLVHYDFHPGNVLSAGGVLTGIIDWDGCRDGDGLLDVAILAFTAGQAADAEVHTLLWSTFFSLGNAERRSVALHHAVLRLTDWSIRHGATAEAEGLVAAGAEALDRLDRRERGSWPS